MARNSAILFQVVGSSHWQTESSGNCPILCRQK